MFVFECPKVILKHQNTSQKRRPYFWVFHELMLSLFVFLLTIVIPYTSAHSRKMKMSVLVEEGVRRLRNHTRGLEWVRSSQVMEEWSRKLRRSGYPETMRHEVIKASVDRFEKICQEEDDGTRPIHQPRSWREVEALPSPWRPSRC